MEGLLFGADEGDVLKDRQLSRMLCVKLLGFGVYRNLAGLFFGVNECLSEDCGKELISILSVFLSYYTLGILILESAKAKRSEAKNVSEQKSVKNFFGGITDFQIFHRSLFYSS